MPGLRQSIARSACLLLLAATIVGPADAGPRERPRLALVPFLNPTGDPAARTQIVWALEQALTDRGFQVITNGRIEPFLRERRIRARHALTGEEARELVDLVDVRYVMLGVIEAWTLNGGPEVGLAARIVEPSTGEAVWSGSVSLHAVQAPGLLAQGRPRTLPEAADRASRRLCRSIDVRKDGSVRGRGPSKRPWANLFAGRPIAYNNPSFERSETLRVAVLPLDNHTASPNAPIVIGELVVAHLVSEKRIELIDPGKLRKVLIDNDIQPLLGLDPVALRRLGRLVGADAVLDGSILRFENGESRTPRIDMYMRLRETRDGEVLWSATSHRDGERSTIAWEFGKVNSMERLAEAAVADMLHSWQR